MHPQRLVMSGLLSMLSSTRTQPTNLTHPVDIGESHDNAAAIFVNYAYTALQHRKKINIERWNNDRCHVKQPRKESRS